MRRPKGGPKKANKMDKTVKFQVTQRHYADILQKAAEACMTIPKFMRQITIHSVVTPRWSREEMSVIKKLIEVANDIHAMVMKAKEEGFEDNMSFFIECRDQVDELINRLRNVSAG